jgi:hypothetical protein
VVAGKGFIQQHFADLVHCIHGTIEGMSFNERDILGVKLLSLTVNTCGYMCLREIDLSLNK